MSITRPPTLTDEEMQKLLSQLADRGARITMTDPRVSATTNWLLASIGGIFLLVGGWLITSVNTLNEKLATVIQQNAYGERIDANQDARLDIYDARLRAVERTAK
jgi:hypothetical protein